MGLRPKRKPRRFIRLIEGTVLLGGLGFAAVIYIHNLMA
ncbi:MAG: hypothetical protein ETSY2_49270 [Candidatus Entotheonella gemina]|uniref:Uncharacterized protein n=1 Tax=Candidatus Entotheonella gemina TaxID=1429439 RepID=W4LAJ5_9BACT|nr:MAG: hypothetical protein ETSY2_49270 [Candidatus Entotheonella gemina]